MLKNASYVNAFSKRICTGGVAVAEGLIAGVGCTYRGIEEMDLAGKLLLPGFQDPHIHTTISTPMRLRGSAPTTNTAAWRTPFGS